MIQLFHSFVFNWSTLLFGLACRVGSLFHQIFPTERKTFSTGVEEEEDDGFTHSSSQASMSVCLWAKNWKALVPDDIENKYSYSLVLFPTKDFSSSDHFVFVQNNTFCFQ